MPKKRFSVEQIISHLREAEVFLAQGQTIGQVCRHIGISEQSYYRWRREYGGLSIHVHFDWKLGYVIIGGSFSGYFLGKNFRIILKRNL